MLVTVKFIYTEEATKIRINLQTFFDVCMQYFGDFVTFLWPAQNIWYYSYHYTVKVGKSCSNTTTPTTTIQLQTFLGLLFFTNSFKTRLICRKKELLNPGLTVMDNFGGVIFQQCCNHVMSISQHAKLSLLKSQAKAR